MKVRFGKRAGHISLRRGRMAECHACVFEADFQSSTGETQWT